jgi:5-dehydro-2-deoxygluconokinase
LLFGWLRGKNWRDSGRIANACGALVVSRHGCAPAMPTKPELDEFLARASSLHSVHADPRIQHLHRVTTRRGSHHEVLALAFDHRRQFEELCLRTGAPATRIAKFKQLIGHAVLQMWEEETATGAIVDDRYGRDVLEQLSGRGMWVARPVERPGSRPLAFDDDSGPAVTLRAWPTEQVAKCLIIYDSVDPDPLLARQEEALLQLEHAADATNREWMLELIPPQGAADNTVIRAMQRLYSIGLTPDWWKLPPSSNPRAWQQIGDLVRAHDPHARGVMLLGLDAPEQELRKAFAAASSEPAVRGFAVGRTIFWPTAQQWFADKIDDRAAVREIAEAYRRIVNCWRDARASADAA